MLFFVVYLFSLLYQEKENNEFFIITTEPFSALYRPVFSKYKIGEDQPLPLLYNNTTGNTILLTLL